MNALINEVNQSGKFGVPPGNETHWTFDWYQPIKPTNNNDNNIQSANDFIFVSKDHDGSRTNLNKSNSNISLADNIPQQKHQYHSASNMSDSTVEKYMFSLKTWLKSTNNDFEAFNLEENNTLNALDLNKFDRTQRLVDDKDQKMIALEKNKRIKEDGLTEKDIRGAVTNAGSIPGLSSSTDSSNVTTTNTTNITSTNTDKSDKNLETTEDNDNNKTDEQNDSNKQSTNNTGSNEQERSDDEKVTLPGQTSNTVTNENQSTESSDNIKITANNSINTDKEGDIEME